METTRWLHVHCIDRLTSTDQFKTENSWTLRKPHHGTNDKVGGKLENFQRRGGFCYPGKSNIFVNSYIVRRCFLYIFCFFSVVTICQKTLYAMFLSLMIIKDIGWTKLIQWHMLWCKLSNRGFSIVRQLKKLVLPEIKKTLRGNMPKTNYNKP